MPRLNVEDEWFDDPRREALIAKIGIVADAIALRMWRLAQTYFRVGKLVPPDLFEKIPHWRDFESAGLADRRDGGVYIKGQRDRFDWLRARQEAGKVGGPAAAKKRNENKRRAATSNDDRNQQPTSSSSSSSSASSSVSDSTSDSKERKKYAPIEELKDPSLDAYLEQVTPELQRKWLEVYRDAAWIKAELRKAGIYHVANPGKWKRLGAGFSNWLSNAASRNPSTKTSLQPLQPKDVESL